MKPKLLLLTFAGGAVGSALRYAFTLSYPQFYWLLIVNLLGAFVLGFIQTDRRFANDEAQSLWGTGFAGGFTTLSGLITFAMLGNDPNFYYVAIQFALGLGTYALGRILGGARS